MYILILHTYVHIVYLSFLSYILYSCTPVTPSQLVTLLWRDSGTVAWSASSSVHRPYPLPTRHFF